MCRVRQRVRVYPRFFRVAEFYGGFIFSVNHKKQCFYAKKLVNLMKGLVSFLVETVYSSRCGGKQSDLKVHVQFKPRTQICACFSVLKGS